jgi:hypothetical protein
VSDRRNVYREVHDLLREEPRVALAVVAALAGEILADGDPVAISDLQDALSRHVVAQEPNQVAAEAVLAMVRTYTIDRTAHFNH